MRLATLLLALFLGLLTCELASAHASMTASEPLEGQILQASPRRLVLSFNEPVAPLVMKLILPDGTSADLGGAVWQDGSLVIPLTMMLGHGSHLLSWRVISQDGHPIGGSLSFSVVGKSVTPGLANNSAAPGLAWAIWIIRTLFYTTLFFGVGGSAWRLAFSDGEDQPRIARQISTLALIAIFPVSFISLGLLGLDALSLDWAGVFTVKAWQAGFNSTYVMTLLLASSAALVVLIAYQSALRWQLPLIGVALVMTAASLAASGHASSATPQWLSRLAVFVHVICLTLWIGALIPLASVFAENSLRRVVLLQCFSRRIVWVIAGLIASGFVLSILQLRPSFDLLGSAYAQILVLKLALVGLLFCLAGWNRFYLTPRLEANGVGAARLFIRSICVELVLVLAIFSVVALWRFTPPPRASVAPASISVHLHSADAMAQVAASSGKAGPIIVDVDLSRHDGSPLIVKEVRLSFALPSAGIQPIRRQADVMPNGHWIVNNVNMQLPGQWTIKIDALIDDFHSTSLEGTISIAPAD